MKVALKFDEHSKDRGIGFYAKNLYQALEKIKEIELVKDNPDIVHYPFFDLYNRSLPILKKYPTVVTIHDLTPLILKDRYPAGIRGLINLFYQKLSLNSVAGIITDSENSKKDIGNLLGIDSSKIVVTPLSHDSVFYGKIPDNKLKEIRKKYSLPERFILNVSGGPNANKNLPFLAEVTSELKIPLVIVGGGMVQKIDRDNVHPELLDLVKLKEYEHIILPGFVPTEDLIGFYQLCLLYCQPSLYEGFGIPVLEAMAAGALLISSNRSSLPELYPKGTITFDPESVESLKAAIESALKMSERERISYLKNLKERSMDFSWDKTADVTVKAYKLFLNKN